MVGSWAKSPLQVSNARVRKVADKLIRRKASNSKDRLVFIKCLLKLVRKDVGFIVRFVQRGFDRKGKYTEFSGGMQGFFGGVGGVYKVYRVYRVYSGCNERAEAS